MTLPNPELLNKVNPRREHCKIYQIALIGAPNCGKTTLFNRLTGAQQTTGNWPGVTVEKKVGTFKVGDKHFNLIDLPGVYSLEASSHSGLDEKVARDFLQCQPVDLVLNVVDATNLERQLFLTAQLLHMGLPVVVVLNRMDLLKERNIDIDVDKLSEKLGCPVIPVSAYYNQGIDELKAALPKYLNRKSDLHFDLPEALHESVHKIRDLLPQQQSASCWHTLQLLLKPKEAPLEVRSYLEAEKKQLEQTYDEEMALLAADLYFQFAHDAAHASLKELDKFSRNTTDAIDQWALHPRWGMPIFLGVMYLLFAVSIAVGNVFLDFFDQGAQALFVDAPAAWLAAIHAPDWVIALIPNGIGAGIQVVATFIPVIGALFLFLTILEETGYMQRAALIMDRSMRKLGLSGQAFIPLVVGFGCNVPAVLATRTLPNQRDRIMTIMMTPFMSCSARLTVYILFAAAFFADHAALLVFSLYLIGIAAAVLTALLLKKTLLPGEAPPLLMELPSYHKPAVLNVLLNTRNKLRGFILDAGKIIVLVVIVLNFFNSLGTDGTFGHQDQPTSVLSTAAKAATPIVEPLGINEDNWPATVGLITGFLAKEVVVGSLDALYQNMGHPAKHNEEESDDGLTSKLSAALATIPANLGVLWQGIVDPLGLGGLEEAEDKTAAAEQQGVTISTLDKMVQHFDGTAGAFAYLLFVLLYFPCVATFGAIKQELGWRWALASGGWSLFLGYSVAVSFYQAATWTQHPQSSLLWIGFFLITYTILILWLRAVGKRLNPTLTSNRL
jgi:ferrous iron transport protein B